MARGDSCPALGQKAVQTATEEKKQGRQTRHPQCWSSHQGCLGFCQLRLQDFTKFKYTKYSFIMKMTDKATGKVNDGNISPHGGFKPCNMDGTSQTRGKSPEFWFIDRAFDYGYGTYNGGLCKTKKDHAKAYAAGAANHKANEAAWNKAHQIECVLDGKTKCTFAGTPRCHAAVVTAAVNSAMCVAAKKKDDCPVGYTQVGTKTKNNDYGGACLGQTFGKTKEQCEGDCNARK